MRNSLKLYFLISHLLVKLRSLSSLYKQKTLFRNYSILPTLPYHSESIYHKNTIKSITQKKIKICNKYIKEYKV